MNQQPIINQETLFNAGVDTALQISKLAKQAEYYASIGDYPNQFIKLEAMEVWMATKFREKRESQEEIDKLKKKYIDDYKRYLHKLYKGKNISTHLSENIKSFLTSYYKSLMFWRDKFGYGMPVKDDPRFILG